MSLRTGTKRILKVVVAVNILLASGNAYSRVCAAKVSSIYVDKGDYVFIYAKSDDGTVNFNPLRVCQGTSASPCKGYFALLTTAFASGSTMFIEGSLPSPLDPCKIDSQNSYADLGGTMYSIRIAK